MLCILDKDYTNMGNSIALSYSASKGKTCYILYNGLGKLDHGGKTQGSNEITERTAALRNYVWWHRYTK